MKYMTYTVLDIGNVAMNMKDQINDLKNIFPIGDGRRQQT